MVYFIVFFAAFACGWAFFKHRASIKAKAQAEAKALANSAVNKIS